MVNFNRKEFYMSKPTLKRALFMVLYIIIGRFTALLIFLFAVFQFVYTLIFKEQNERVSEVSKPLAQFAKQIASYLMMLSEEKPWPLGDWPESEKSVVKD
jgi:hypothetical protein